MKRNDVKWWLVTFRLWRCLMIALSITTFCQIPLSILMSIFSNFPKSPLRDLSILIFFRIAFRYYAMWPWHQIERVWRLQPVDNLFSSCDSQSAQAKRCLEGSFFTIPSLSARTWQSDGIKKYKVKALVSSSELLSQESWRDQNKLRLIDIGE